MSLIILEDDNAGDVCSDEELAFFKVRDQLLDIVLDSSHTLSQKLIMLHNDFEVFPPDKTISQWTEIFLSLEHLSDEWPSFVAKLKSFEPDELNVIDSPRWQCQYSRLLHYFLFRHLSGADSNVDFRARISFAVLSVQMIAALFVCNGVETFDSLADIARMYSSEIEYSDENLYYLIDLLKVDLYV